MFNRVRCLWPVGALLGEGPIVIEREQRVYFVDIKAPAVHALNLTDGERRTWAMPESICWLIPAQNGDGFVAGFRHTFARLWLEPEVRIEIIGYPQLQYPENRLNDAKRDRHGHIFAGSMHETDHGQAVGVLFRLDTNLSWREVDRGYHICNGPAFSPDGRTMYHNDSYLKRVYAYDLAEDGSLSNRRVWRQFAASEGSPDGMACAWDGSLYIALWGGWGIGHFSAQGDLLRRIALPVSQVSSCVFANAQQSQLIVTSAQLGLSPDQLAKEPLAGSLFEADLL
jgi:xylono-1,5-lactonase